MKGFYHLPGACAHNPTGVDLSPSMARPISALKKTDLQLFFDCAYQGFASGDAEADAVALRSFVEDGHQILLCQSYAKNFGLYGERVGALSAVCASTEEKAALESQLKAIIRPMYSSPPIHGARIVKEVLVMPLRASGRASAKKWPPHRTRSCWDGLAAGITRTEPHHGPDRHVRVYGIVPRAAHDESLSTAVGWRISWRVEPVRRVPRRGHAVSQISTRTTVRVLRAP